VDLSLVYFPSAILLGALHALEPGHAKTLTAAYLIGTKGTKRDATILGLAVATTHSLVVVGLSIAAVMIGRETFTDEASHYLAVGSSIAVILLGTWLLVRRLKALKRSQSPAIRHHPLKRNLLHSHRHHHHGEHTHSHDHALLSDEEHARAHASTLPKYVGSGERPTILQIIAFGAAGGLVPCPAAIGVMLLSLSLGESGKGLFMVLGFSIGLALTLVGVGLLVVTGLTKVVESGRFNRFSATAPSIAAGMVIFSGALGLLTAYWH